MAEQHSDRLVQTSLFLAASLLEAMDAEAVLRAVMRAGCEVLGADGCMFMPFNEFSARLHPLAFGRIPAFDAERLRHPSQRQQCKLCQKRRAGRECPLLQCAPDSSFMHCLPLRFCEREAGLFSFVFSAEPEMDSTSSRFFAEAAHLAELTLEALERRQWTRGTEDFRHELDEHTRSLLAGIETRAVLQERARLAREIHDGLAQTLAFLKIEIGRAETLLANGETEHAARILKDSSRTLADAYLDAREAIENLRHTPDESLAVWLNETAADFTELSGIPVNVDLRLTHDFPPIVQAQLIRIVQEALTNVRKHARASSVRLRAWEDGEDALIEVADDGRGFYSEDVLVASRFGLRGMRERAESVGAEFQIVSHPKSGTMVRLRVPLRVSVKS